MSIADSLDVLVQPRKNGSVALAQMADYLERTLRATGAQVSLHEFVCRPYVGRIAGVVGLVLAVGYFASMWRRHFGWALLVAWLLTAYLVLDGGQRIPLLNRIGALPERNVIASFPVPEPRQLLVLTAHYDTTTDLLDQYRRAPIQFLIGPVLLYTMILPVVAWWRRLRGRPERHGREWASLTVVFFLGFFLTMCGGALVSTRSPGALDDGAAVATLLQLAAHLGAGEPRLEHTQVDIVLFAGEEVGRQGSTSFVAERFATPAALPTYVVSAEGWGAGPTMSYFVSDRSAFRRYEASMPLVRVLDRAYRRLTNDIGLVSDIEPVTTDARSFMMAGIPSVTIGSQRNGDREMRALRSAADSRDRIQPGALERALAFLQAALVEIDQHGVSSET